MAIKVGKAKPTVALYDELILRETDITAEIESLLANLRIDANNLAEEAVSHPSLFGRIATLAEEASSEARYARRALDIAKAEVDGRIRRDAAVSMADGSGGKKPTEGQIENLILLDSEIIELTEATLDAERTAGIIGALRQSFRDRREMIVELMRDKRHENGSYGPGD